MRLHQWQVWGWRRMHLPILALFFFVKAFSKYFSCLFLFLMHVPQKKGMNQTSPVSASKAQDNLRQHQLSSLLSNTLSGQPWSFWNHSVVVFFCFFFFCSNRFFFTVRLALLARVDRGYRNFIFRRLQTQFFNIQCVLFEKVNLVCRELVFPSIKSNDFIYIHSYIQWTVFYSSFLQLGEIQTSATEFSETFVSSLVIVWISSYEKVRYRKVQWS